MTECVGVTGIGWPVYLVHDRGIKKPRVLNGLEAESWHFVIEHRRTVLLSIKFPGSIISI